MVPMSYTVTQEIEIEPATQNDLPAIESLLTACKLPLDGVKDLVDEFVVARSSGRVVGVAAVEPCGAYGLLRSAAVDQSMRGRGVGRALVQRLIADSEMKGYRALYLLTTTAENYFPAFGFIVTAREAVPVEIQATSQFKDICRSTATVMRRSLGNA
jgi:amino-acid N-acetyltransferase